MAFRTNKTPVLQTKSASGSVATFNTALAMPLSSCNIAVNAWQEGSGDPSPDNVRPIHGFDKINLVNSRIAPVNKLIPITAKQSGSGDPSPDNVRPITAGLTIVRDDDTTLEVYGGTLDAVSGELTMTHMSKVLNGTENWYDYSSANGFYYSLPQMRAAYNDGLCDKLTRTKLTSNFGIVFGLANSVIYCTQIKNNIEGITTVSKWKTWLSSNNIKIVYPLATSETIQLSATELARAKEALGIDTYTIQLGQEVYGAEVDVVNGVAHCTHGIIIFNGTETWNIYGSSTGYYVYLQAMKQGRYNDGLSDKFKLIKNNNQLGIMLGYDNKIAYFCQINQNISEVTDLATWKTWLSNNNVELVYPLATPFDIQLTPTQIETLIGNNTIFADTGDVDLTYKDLDIAKRGNFREVFRLPS